MTARAWLSRRSKWFWICLTPCICLLFAIIIGVGVALGVKEGNGSPNPAPTSTIPPFSSNNSNATQGNFWRPAVGASWQIVLEYELNDTSVDASVYDIDLFDNPASMITNLHAMNRSVICYFSAGTFEPDRPDSYSFNNTDLGGPVFGWPGEVWLNTSSSNVRDIMNARLQLAASKGCDGVDPDNVDAFDNNSGLALTPSDSVDYLTFLAISAHSLGLAIGLKNAGKIVNQTLPMMQWEVNEQCVDHGECDLFQPFIAAGKPVFHIEYPASETLFTKAQLCGQGDKTLTGFSTVLKNMDLDDFVEAC